SNFAASVPYSLKSQRETLTEFLDDLSKRDQKMFLAVVTAAVSGRTMDELESKTSALMSCAEGYGCRFSVLGFEQYEGLETVMPLGLRCVSPLRTLTSESLSALVPFRTREVFHLPGGTYRGINTVSGSIISIDRSRLINGNEFILGVPGSGKSFCAKNEIASLAMRGDCDIVIVDPEREYSRLVRMIGGETVCISPDSGCHINALDLVPAEEGDPVSEKSDFVLTLIGEIMEKDEPGPGEKSVIDRCLRKVLLRDGPGIPTLKDLRDEISRQTDPGAAETALALEIFTEGSLSTFSKPTNVDFSSHIVSYDISEMGRQLEPAAMLVILDSIAGRIERNRRSGRRTYLFIDEFYLLMRRERSARFLSVLWKRVRKCGAFATGITQNVDEVLGSPSASTMLANSELTVMMRQAPQDLERLSGLLGIGKEAGKWLSSPDPGTGLIKVGNDLIPFTSGFPEGTELYGLMTTRPGEAPAS
ncbi:MAG: VirB4-like conjugal transfer ATPase, CD1110 family, partial [Oscillospiraceae bacterium]